MMMSFGRTKAKKKLRSRNKTTLWTKLYRQHKNVIQYIVPITILCLLMTLAIVLAKKTFLAKKYTIQDVHYAPESVAMYDDPYLYKAITEEMISKNYYLMKWYQLDDIRSDIRTNFPIVKNIIVERAVDHEIYIQIDFHTPTIQFQTPNQYIAVYNKQLFPLVSGNTLGQDVLTVQLPAYTSGFDSLYGILYEFDEKELSEKIQAIMTTLGEQYISEIIYLPGGMKIFIVYKGKKVYFHIEQEINRQIAKLIDLENYYEGFNDITVIDLGSIDDIIVR